MSKPSENELQELLSQIVSSKTTNRKKGIVSLRDYVIRHRSQLNAVEEKYWSALIKKIISDCIEVEIEIKTNKKTKTNTISRDFSFPFKEIVITLIEFSKVSDDDNFDHEFSYLLSSKCIKELVVFLYKNMSSDEDDEYNRSLDFGIHSCEILNCLMGTRHYAVKLNSKLFNDFIRLLIDLILTTKLSQTDGMHYSSCIESLVTGFSRDLDIENINILLEFFEKYFKDVPKVNNFEKVQLNLICTLNFLTKNYALNLSEVFRNLGSSICYRLCQIWIGSNNDQLRIEIFQFFRMILRLQYSIDDVVLQRDKMFDLFVLVRDTLNNSRIFSFHAKNMSTRELQVQIIRRDIYFDFVADCFYQMSLLQKVKIEEQEEEDQSSTTNKKKRKILTIFEEILQTFNNLSNDDSLLVNWIRGLYNLLIKYFLTFKKLFESVYERLFIILSERIQTDDVQIYILRIFRYVLLNHSEEISASLKEFLKVKLFSSLLKILRTECTSLIKETFSLLSILLERVDNNLALDKEFLVQISKSKYLKESNYVCNETIHFILCLAQLQHKNKQIAKYLFDEKNTILEWLFNSLNFGENVTNTLLFTDVLSCFLFNSDRVTRNFIYSLYDHKLEDNLSNFSLLLDPIRLTNEKEVSNNIFPQLDNISNIDEHSVLSTLLAPIQKVFPNLLQGSTKTKDTAEIILKVLKLIEIITHMAGLIPILKYKNIFDFISKLLCKGIDMVVENFHILSNNTNFWKSTIQQLISILNINSISPFIINIQPNLEQIVKEVLVQLNSDMIEKVNNVGGLGFSTGSQQTDDVMLIDDDEEESSSKVNFNNSGDEKKDCRKVLSLTLELCSVISSLLPSISSTLHQEMKRIFEKSNNMNVKLEILLSLADSKEIFIIQDCFEMIPRKIGDSKSFYFVSIILNKLSKYISDPRVNSDFEEQYLDLLNSLLHLYEKDFMDQTSVFELFKCIHSTITYLTLDKKVEYIKQLCKGLTEKRFLSRLYLSSHLVDVLSVDEIDSTITQLKELIEKSNDRSILRTSILGISCLALKDIRLEKDIVFYLLKLYSNVDFIERTFVKSILGYLSKKLEYNSLVGLLEEHLKDILFYWLKEHKDLTGFPYDLYQQLEPTSFYEEYASSILPLLILKEDLQVVETFSSYINYNLTNSISVYFNYIFANCFATYFIDPEKGKKLIENILRGQILKNEMDSYMRKNITDIIVELLFLIGIKGDLPYFEEKVITVALVEFAKSLKKNSIEDLLKDSKNRIHIILLNLHELLSSTHRPYLLNHYFNIFKLVILEYLGNSLFITSIIRSVIRVIMFCVSKPSLLEKSCSLLEIILDKVVNRNDPESIKEISNHLPTITNQLVNILMENPNQQTLNVLSKIVGAKCFGNIIRELEPFPNTTIFKEINNYHNQIRGILTLEQQIKRFIYSSIVSLSGIEHISKIIKENKDKLIDLLKLERESEETDQPIYRLVQELISKLLNICNSTDYGNNWKIAASNTIGQIGLICSVDQIKTKSFVDEIDVKDINTKENWIVKIFNNAKIKLLKQLNSYLMDSDINVIKVATQTLCDILKTNTGKELYKLLDKETQIHLQPLTFSSSDGTVELKQHTKLSKGKTDKLVLSNTISDELFNTTNKSHDEWVKTVTYALLKQGVQDELLVLCDKMCLEKTSFAEQVFIIGIFDISQGKNFKNYCKQLSPLLQKHVFEGLNTKKETIRLLITTIDLLHRSFRETVKEKGLKKSSRNVPTFFFSIPYLTVAKAALRADLSYPALLFTENHFEREFALSTVDQASMEFDEVISEQHRLLLNIYKDIDESDSIYGVTHSYGIHSKILLAQREGEWVKALGCFDSLQGTTGRNDTLFGGSSPTSGILQSLKNIGLNQLSSTFLKGIQKQQLMNDLELRDLYFENCWRNFSLNTDINISNDSIIGFNEAIYNSISNLVKGNAELFEETLNIYKNILIQNINTLHPQEHLTKLQMLSEIEQAWEMKWGKDKLEREERIPLNDQVRPFIGTYGLGNNVSFEYLEPILSVRSCILHALKRDDLLEEHYCKLISIARKEGRQEYASNLIHKLSTDNSKYIVNQNNNLPFYLIEEAKNKWKSGEHNSAISVLKFLAQNIDGKTNRTPLLAKASYLVGKWLGDTKTDSYNNIVNYLQFAIDNYTDKSKAHFQMAKYVDSLYENIERKEKSEEYKVYKELLQKNKALYQQYQNYVKGLKKGEEPSREIKSKLSYLEKIVSLDMEEQKNMASDKERYRNLLLDNYGLSAKFSDKYDLITIPRILSIWFTNSNIKEVNEKIYKLYNGGAFIPSYKFLPLMYQIASRMGYYNDDANNFNRVLMFLLMQIARQHPHHSIYQIMQIRNGEQVTKDRKKSTIHKPDPNKIKSANYLIEKLSSENSVLITQYETLIDAYIQLAFLPLDPKKYKNMDEPLKLSSKLKISKIEQLDKVPVSTIDVPIINSGDYQPTLNNFGIKKFDEYFSLAGGINLPKIITCISNEGKRYRQLVKGNDDLRQDHVIEQLFGIVNRFLRADKDTRKRKLLIRTYKVMPTTPTSGFLGFVENTQPLANLLMGDPKEPQKSLHGQYRPNDWPSFDCRRKIGEIEKMSDTTVNKKAKKLKLFNAICDNFKPVFHHFFLEKYPNPNEWFEKRLAYTKSVATTSMIGYVIGLGDRHASNILIDQTSAEAVHIDLGICFEQGKYLPVPEIVPFRLTRDIVDGFGVCGIEGLFKNSCYATMNVLRNNMEALSLIVEVFLHDPLYRWALSPLEAMNFQRNIDEDDEVDDSESLDSTSETSKNNRDAERALLRFKQKLQGFEEGELLNVKGQVNKLINEASSKDNLAVMFSGWSPFL
ncbi:hypothetical protein ABK040_013876 [Willaertia magna]